MATGTKEPASKSLNYGLTGDILDRVSDAGVTRRPKESVAEVAQDLGEDLYEVGKEKKEFGELADAAWNEGFDAQGERGDWVSPELYDQFQKSEMVFKEAYLDAVNSGDKTLAATLLQKQGGRAASLDGWKDIMASAKEIDDSYGWGVLMTENPENQAIMMALSKNDGSAVMRIDDSGSIVFDIDIDGKTRTVTKSEIDKMVAKSVKPLERENAWFASVDQAEQRGAEGKPFRPARAAKANLRQINIDNIKSYIDEPFTGYDSFATEFLASTEFSNPNTQSRLPATADGDLNKDGKITADEKNLDMSIKENMIAFFRTPEGFEMGKVEIAAWMTAKQMEKHGGGASALQAQRDAAQSR